MDCNKTLNNNAANGAHPVTQNNNSKDSKCNKLKLFKVRRSVEN
jgi:hypothetical protein